MTNEITSAQRRPTTIWSFDLGKDTGLIPVDDQIKAHTDPNSADPRDWEPLFTPGCPALAGGHYEACEKLERFLGHLNKVAWWTAKFAGGMVSPAGSPVL